MKIRITDDFDLKKIADSGQCFRFDESSEGFDVRAMDKYLFIKKITEEEYELSCDKAEYEGFWKGYFDLDLNYSDIRKKIDPVKDDYLYRAAEFGQGIRILKQDPWEMLISFIISQRKNIPAIKASIEKLCEKAGKKIGETPEGKAVFSFPTPEELAALSMEDLSGCSLGYRDKYVYKAARDVLEGTADLEAWEKLDDEELMEKLLSLFGVGVKVANCEILFGYHRLDAFPKDVWINRVLENHYSGGFSFEDYAPYNGVMQQYLFYYSRLQSML